MCPYHSHSAQTEMYVIVAGRGQVRSAEGCMDIGPGDAFVFQPHEPYQMIASATEDLTFYIIADDPPSDSCYYPDSDKWLVPARPRRRILRGVEWIVTTVRSEGGTGFPARGPQAITHFPAVIKSPIRKLVRRGNHGLESPCHINGSGG